MYGHVSGEQSDEIRPIFEAICQKSDILHPDDTSRLLNMLPQAVIRDGLELAFSTTRCGWALGSLYAEVKDLRPCVLLLQTLPQERSRGRSASDAGKNFEKSDSEVSEPKVIGEDDDDDITNFASQEERGVILGVYLPCTMSPPSTSVRGDPEAFVFRLTDGLGASSSVPANKGFKFQSSMSTKKGGIIPPGSDGATLSQFAVCASSYMSFGASSKHSTNAIRIDEELRWVATGASDTFSSPPLLISSECDTNAMAGLTMIPARRGSFSSAALSPGIRPSRSRSQSQENIGAGSPQSSILGAASAPAPVDIDYRASIKHIEVWVGKSSFNSSSGNKTKQSILGR